MRLNPELWAHYLYLCDECQGAISKVDPVIIINNNHLCSIECWEKWDAKNRAVSTRDNVERMYRYSQVGGTS